MWDKFHSYTTMQKYRNKINSNILKELSSKRLNNPDKTLASLTGVNNSDLNSCYSYPIPQTHLLTGVFAKAINYATILLARSMLRSRKTNDYRVYKPDFRFGEKVGFVFF